MTTMLMGFLLFGGRLIRMFNAQNPLDTVHSQTRRMVMICPEPNFWIHAVSCFFIEEIFFDRIRLDEFVVCVFI